MKVVRNAIADRLLSLSDVTSRISLFRGVPAVFSQSPIPSSAEGTYIVVRDAHVDLEFATKTPTNAPADYVATRGRDVEHDIAIYADQTGDASDLEDLALIVRESFNRHPLTISGYGTLVARARGPIEVPQGEAGESYVDGRLITVALTIIKRP